MLLPLCPGLEKLKSSWRKKNLKQNRKTKTKKNNENPNAYLKEINKLLEQAKVELKKLIGKEQLQPPQYTCVSKILLRNLPHHVRMHKL